MLKENPAGLGRKRRGIGVCNAVVSALHGRTRGNRAEPAIQAGKVREIEAETFMRDDPWITGDVGNGVVAGNVVALGEVAIEHGEAAFDEGDLTKLAALLRKLTPAIEADVSG